MKKILFLLFIGGGLFFASCTKNYPVVQPNQTLFSDPIASSDWTTADTGKNYTTTISPPQGSQFDTNAGILIYFSFDNGTTFEQIPETYNNVSFTYTYTSGIITLFAQSANGAQVIPAPAALTAKIVLVDSQ